MKSYDTNLNFVERNGTFWDFCRIYSKDINFNNNKRD